MYSASYTDDKSFSRASDFQLQGTCKIISCPIDTSRLVMVRCVLGEHYDEPPRGFDGVAVGIRPAVVKHTAGVASHCRSRVSHRAKSGNNYAVIVD
jgi:hypothetical protein